MKTLSLSGIVVALACLSAVPVSAGLSTGLDGYWTFNQSSGGTVYDSSGNGYNGTVVNYANNQGDWTSGLFGGNALQFGGPGTSQYVSVPNFAVPTSSMTLTAWVWADSLPAWATIAENWNGGYGAFTFSTFGSNPDLSIYTADLRYPQGGINVDSGSSSTGLTTGQWHFVAFVANSSADQMTFIQDGVATGTFYYRGQLIPSSSQLTIGGQTGNWNGRIDDLAIWTRPLSYDELDTIYQAGLNGQPLLTLVPEPSALGLLVIGAAAFFGYRRLAASCKSVKNFDLNRPI